MPKKTEHHLPKKLWVGNTEYTVHVFKGKKRNGKNRIVGSWSSSGRIMVDGTGSKIIVDQRFFHELVHAILYESGHVQLCFDERFVDRIAWLLADAFHTAEFD